MVCFYANENSSFVLKKNIYVANKPSITRQYLSFTSPIVVLFGHMNMYAYPFEKL